MNRFHFSRRHFLATATASGLTAGLAACGQAPVGPSAERAPDETQPKVAAVAQPTPEPITVVWLDARPGWVGLSVYEAQPAIMQQQHPHITVRIDQVPDGEDRVQRLRTLEAAGTAPDLFTQRSLDVTTLYASMADLTPFMQRNPDEMAALFPAALRMYHYKYKQTAMPRDLNPYVLYYNRTLFGEAGVEPPLHWTWDDVVVEGRALNKPDASEPQHAILVRNKPESWMSLLWAFGGDWVTADSTAPTCTHPRTVEAVRFVRDLMNKQRVAAPHTHEMHSGHPKAAEYFVNGQLAMYMMVPGFARHLANANVAPGSYDIALNPTGSAGRATRAGGNSYAMLDSSTVKDAAWLFTLRLLDQAVVRQLVAVSGLLPSNRPVAYSETFLRPNQDPASSQLYVDSIEFARPGPQIPHYREVERIIQPRMNDVWSGTLEPEEALAQAQTQIEALYAEKGV